VWYWMVKQATGKSDEQLDKDYLPQASKEGTRPRFFQRIRSLGSDPSRSRNDLKKKSVFECVHGEGSDPRLDAARDAFCSSLWSMLSDPSWSLEDYNSFIDEVIEREGWYRANEDDRKLALVFFREDPAFGLGSDREHVYSSMLTYFESNPTADNVAVLAALFREALGEVELEKAIQLRSALRGTTALWLRRMGELPYEVSSLMQQLVEDRLVRNNWYTPTLDSVPVNQRRYVRALASAHLKHSTGAMPKKASSPIVLRSPRLEWLAAHRSALEKAAEYIGQAQQNVFNYVGGQVFVEGGIFEREDWDKLMHSREQDAQAWRDYEKSIRDVIRPPPRDTRFCLPVQPHKGTRHHGRAAPYLTDGSLENEN
jgi:hypothetical protein